MKHVPSNIYLLTVRQGVKVFKVNAKDLSFLEKKLARQWPIVSSTLSGRITQTWRVYGSIPTDALGQALWANFLLKILLRVGFRAAKQLIKKSLNKVYIFFSVFLAFFFFFFRYPLQYQRYLHDHKATHEGFNGQIISS